MSIAAAVRIYILSSRLARVSINRVRLPIILVVSWTGKIDISISLFAPEDLVSLDGFGSPVPRNPAVFIIELNLVLTYGIPPDFRGGVQLLI